MDEPDNVSVETLISTHLYHVKTPLNMQYVVLHNVQHHLIIIFLLKLVFVHLLQVNATLASLLSWRESPHVGHFCTVAVMFWFRCLLAFAGLSVSSPLPSPPCGKWIQGATAKQKSDEHDFVACKSARFAA